MFGGQENAWTSTAMVSDLKTFLGSLGCFCFTI
jgi:hypothetical protein